MYFLRRRHGRKPPNEARREIPPGDTPPKFDSPEPEAEAVEPAKPKVITKTRRPRVDSPVQEDCKPAGTFRAGTLHLDRRGEPSARQGKL